MDIAAALAYLDSHTNFERSGRLLDPSIARMARLVTVMGDPQMAYPVIHVTGTNGKGSTTAIAAALLAECGLNVGTFTSPHLEVINERITRNGEMISDPELAEMIEAVADLEVLAGVRPSYFEILAAAALRWFADVAVDVAVIEVGMLGRWDATNVVESRVAVVTNIGLDHTEMAGPTRHHIAKEKAGIVKPGSTLVLGETDPELGALFAAQQPASTLRRDIDYDVLSNTLALGGRLLDIKTPMAVYNDVFLPLNGEHQGDNAVTALVAVEAFFDAPLDQDIVVSALGTVKMPGRFEVLGHQPLVIVDGAHNPAGAQVCASVMSDDFEPAGDRIYVVGFLSGKDPAEMLEALEAPRARLVICCTPPSPRGLAASDVAEAAKAFGVEVAIHDDVERACDRALDDAGSDDAILVAGSLYVAGPARTHLRRRLRRT
jgi:dihydrofolate synthase / folylpolyglutamate synthase